MGILTKLLTVFNSLSPVEVTPTAWAVIDAKSDKDLSKLADKASLVEIQRNLMLDVINMVRNISIASALADIASNHPRQFREANESPKDTTKTSKIDDYLKKAEYDKASLDKLTVEILNCIAIKYPSMYNLMINFSKSTNNHLAER